KIWNSFRLIKGWEISDEMQPESSKQSVEWFQNQLDKQLSVIDDHFSKYRMSDALMAIYKLVWDDYCSWYLEMIKPEFGKPIDKITIEQTTAFVEKLLCILHPFMPFIS